MVALIPHKDTFERANQMKPYYMLTVKSDEGEFNVHPFKTNAKAIAWYNKHHQSLKLLSFKVKLIKE